MGRQGYNEVGMYRFCVLLCLFALTFPSVALELAVESSATKRIWTGSGQLALGILADS